MAITCELIDGIAEVVIDIPPVNAPKVADWFGLADTIRDLGRSDETRVVVLRAEGRGFCAGIDIKEVQADPDKGIIGVNRGCMAAFRAIYECEVPVVCAVHGFCLGGGIGLAGSSDVIVASDDAYFGLPEVDRGALGGGTHLARLVPQPVMRAMFFTGENITAAQLHHYGSVWRVVPRDELRETASGLAKTIAAKHPRVIRAAKEALNGIDPVRVHDSYRYEQGYTFELHVAGVGDELRKEFVDKRE